MSVGSGSKLYLLKRERLNLNLMAAATALDVITSDELCSDALFDCLPLSEVMALAVRTFATVQHGTRTAVSHPSCPSCTATHSFKALPSSRVRRVASPSIHFAHPPNRPTPLTHARHPSH